MFGKDMQVGDYLGIRMASEPAGAMRWGVIKQISSEALLLELRYIGVKRMNYVLSINLTDIACIETNNLFIRAMKSLDQRHVSANQQQPRVEIVVDRLMDDSNSVMSFLDENHESQTMGLLCEMDAGALKVQRLDEYGRMDGFSILSRKYVRYMRLNGDEEQEVEFLHLASR